MDRGPDILNSHFTNTWLLTLCPQNWASQIKTSFLHTNVSCSPFTKEWNIKCRHFFLFIDYTAIHVISIIEQAVCEVYSVIDRVYVNIQELWIILIMLLTFHKKEEETWSYDAFNAQSKQSHFASFIFVLKALLSLTDKNCGQKYSC